MKKQAPLTIYILCYNRPDFAKQSILSVLGQTSQKLNLIVSDHSSNDEVEEMVGKNFPDVTYIRRSPSLRHLEHFNLCIDEVESDYYCLFHDDDVMAPNFVEAMLKFIHDHPNAAAYASNAYIEAGGKIEKRPAFLSHKKYEVFDAPKRLAERYFSRNQSGIAPNPSYIYSSRIAGDQRFIVDGGKYADVSLLLDIAQQGPIIWLNKPLMTYRMHGNNLGSVESLPDRLRFLAYLKKFKKILGKEVLQDYRSSFIYKRLLRNNSKGISKRFSTAKSYLNNYHCYHYTRLSTYKALMLRALDKWGTYDLR
jgi:glycosyltransferase involved in cell wall biosynthesis